VEGSSASPSASTGDVQLSNPRSGGRTVTNDLRFTDQDTVDHSPEEIEQIAEEYISRAKELYAETSEDIQIDDEPVVTVTEDGAWVAAWVWVGKDEEEIEDMEEDEDYDEDD
jgi:hypothetical protein